MKNAVKQCFSAWNIVFWPEPLFFGLNHCFKKKNPEKAGEILLQEKKGRKSR
jgi:hypothetical protein